MYPRKVIFLATALFCTAGLWTASAQTVNIVSGNGQVRCFQCVENLQPFTDLVVQVNDSLGRPAIGATVTWSTSGTGQGVVTQTTTTTDTNGQSSNQFFQNPLRTFGQSMGQTAVVATALGASATFTETTSFSDPTTGLAQIQVRIVSGLDPGTTVTGQIGQQNPTPIVVYVYGFTGPPIPGVGVRINAGDPASGPTIQCASPRGEQPGTVFTDATGTATCIPVFGGKPGQDSFTLDIGNNWRIFPANPANFSVSLGPPANIHGRMNSVGGDTSGNNQTGNTNSALPAPLVIQVEDAGGNPLENIPLVWDLPLGNGTLTRSSTVTDPNGQASAYLTLGPNAGNVQVRVRVPNTNLSYVFSATAVATYTGLTIVSGNSQSATVGAAYSPLVVQVLSGSVGVANVNVAFAVTSGSATLSSSTAATDASGRASVNVTAGQTVGSVQISASIGNFSQQFTLSVLPLGPSNVTFVNGAGGQLNQLAPCSVGKILGTNITIGLAGAVLPDVPFGPQPLTLPGTGFSQPKVTVQFGNNFAPIFGIANQNGVESITFQVPCDVPAGNVPVTIRIGGTSITVITTVQSTAPGIFEQSYDGPKRATVIRSNGSLATLGNPALRGETVRVLVTGLGQANGNLTTNQVYAAGLDVLAPVIVGLANRGIPTISARYSANLLGVYEVVFQIPADAQSGIQPLAIAIDKGGTLQFANPSAIPIQ